MKYIYIVDHFVPFPSSEYGGLWNVIASGDEECFDLITEVDEGWNEPHYNKLRENITKALAFPIQDDEESRVVMEFTT